MRDLVRHIGSADNLIVFEAAARLGSFSKAAEDLGLTQPAVSQAVRRLELAVGTRLFLRSHRALTVTDSGDRPYLDVADRFSRILATVRQIRRSARGEHATLLLSTAFATWWMVPRMAESRARHPQVDLRLETRDKDLVLMSPPRHALFLPCADGMSGSAARAVAMTRSRTRTRDTPSLPGCFSRR